MTAPSSVDESQLAQNLASAEALVQRLREALSQAPSKVPDGSSKSINPLALSSTAASLLKAHTTKLTLLVLNKPFTPSAITQILSTISTSPLPALLTAAEICHKAKFGKLARQESHALTDRALAAYESVLKDIPTTEEDQARKLAVAESQPGGGNGKENALRGAGLVWQACDEITNFAEEGVSGIAAKQMTAFRALFEDAKDELHSWLETAQEEKYLENHVDKLKLGEDDEDLESIESFSAGPEKEMIPVATWALGILDLVFLLFSPLIKRRIKRFPLFNSKTAMEAMPRGLAGLDRLFDSGKYWSKQIDEIAEALYENEKEAAVSRVDQLVASVEVEIQAVKTNWEGAEDELSAWLLQWHRKFATAKTNRRPAL